MLEGSREHSTAKCPRATADQNQFVWELRYDDDLVVRDRVTAQSSSTSFQATNERLYVLHDFFNTTAVINTSGKVVECYCYDAYDTVRFMDPNFDSCSSFSYGWETLYGAYRWDPETALYHSSSHASGITQNDSPFNVSGA